MASPSSSRNLPSSREASGGSRSPTRKPQLPTTSSQTTANQGLTTTVSSASASATLYRSPRSPKLSSTTRSSTSTRLPLLDPLSGASPKTLSRASTSERSRHQQPLIKDVRTRRSIDQSQGSEGEVTSFSAASPSHRRRRANAPLASVAVVEHQGSLTPSSSGTRTPTSARTSLSPIRTLTLSGNTKFGQFNLPLTQCSSAPHGSDDMSHRRVPLLTPLTRPADKRADHFDPSGSPSNGSRFTTLDSLGSPVEHNYSIDMTTTSAASTATTLSPYNGHRFSVTSAASSMPSGLLSDRSDTSTVGPMSMAEPSSPPPPYVRSRRTAVSSEPVTIQSIRNWHPPVHPKTPEEEGRISQVISTKLNVLFGHLSKENESRVVSAMFKKQVPVGTVLIKQGDEGDNFYIVDEGRFDIFVQRAGGPRNKVLEATQGMSFGELALMYNAPRAATCVASEPSVVWALDRTSFRMLLVTAENTKKKRYETLLERIEIFKCLTKYERSQLSDILVVQECDENECVIRQGDRGDRFYIVESGELVCKIKQDDGPELEVHRYRRGGYFGELALIMKYGVRKASVYSVGNDTRLLWIGKSTFDRVLGPIIDILRKNANLYPTYAQLLNRKQ